MQQMLYEDMPEIELWYPNSFEAWRGDRWTGFLPWPEPDGFVFWGHTYSLDDVRPVAKRTRRVEAGPTGWMWSLGSAADRWGHRLLIVRQAARRCLLRLGGRDGGGPSVRLRKVLEALVTLAFVLVFNFFLFRIMPSDPVKLLTQATGSGSRQVRRARSIARARPGQALPAQFLTYAGNTLRGDFGPTFLYQGQRVMECSSGPVADVLLVGRPPSS